MWFQQVKSKMTPKKDDYRQQELSNDTPIFNRILSTVRFIEKVCGFLLSSIIAVAATYTIGWLLWTYEEARFIALLVVALVPLIWIISRIVGYKLKASRTLNKVGRDTIIPVKKSASDGMNEINGYSKSLGFVAVGFFVLIATPLIVLMFFGFLFSAVGLGMGIVIILLILILLK